MPATRVRADYDSLTQISKSFGRHAAATQRVVQKIQQCMGVLQSGDWIGQGAKAFFKEMEGEVLPSLRRLASALEAAERISHQASQVMSQAENESAGIFRVDTLGGGLASGGVAGGLLGGLGVGGVAGGLVGGLAGGLAGIGAAGADGGGTDFDEFEGFLADYVAQYGSFEGTGDVLQLERAETESPFSTGADSKYGAAGGGSGGGGGGGGGGGSGVGNSGSVIDSKGDKFGGGAGPGARGLSLGDRATGFLAKGSIGGGLGGSLSARGDVGLNLGGANIGISLKGGAKPSIGINIAKKASARLPFATVGVSFIGAKV